MAVPGAEQSSCCNADLLDCATSGLRCDVESWKYCSLLHLYGPLEVCVSYGLLECFDFDIVWRHG